MNGLLAGILLVAMAMTMGSLQAQTPSEKPFEIKNRLFTLSFDRETGAWIRWIDNRSGDNLLADPAPRTLLPGSAGPVLDRTKVEAELAADRAIQLAGEWQYAPDPGDDVAFRALLAGRTDLLKWEATPAPSQAGVGDNKLHNRTGDFWYRKEFNIPANWSVKSPLLVIGAVDDFDTTYVNGLRVGTTGSDTPHFWEAPRFYKIPASILHKDKPNIILIKLTNGGFDGGLFGPIALGESSALMPQSLRGPSLTADKLNAGKKGTVFVLANRVDGWENSLTYSIGKDSPIVKRQLTVRNISGKTASLNTTILSTPPIVVGPNQSILFPGSLPVGDTPLSNLMDGSSMGSRSQDPLAVLWDAGKKRGVGAWYHCEQEWSPVSVKRVEGGAELRHSQGIAMNVKDGETIQLGTQYLWLTRGSRNEVIQGVQKVYADIGLKAPSNSLPGLKNMAMYCGHPGGTPEMNYRGYGGFNKFTEYLPVLQKMHIDMVWFLPIWEHGDGIKWNLYSPFNHFKVSSLYGTPDELKRFSGEGVKRGVRLVFDLVPHGPPDFTPLAKEHPDWVSKDQNGKPIYEWSQCAFDNANPGWQDYMRRAADMDAREFGAVGARVDCGAGGSFNWDEKSGHRPSESGLMAGLGMNRAIREGFLKSRKSVMILPEEYTGANIYYRVADLTYDAQLYFLMEDLQERQASPEEWASSLQRFFNDQQASLPPGALKMRWISNHDTVSWTFQKQRPAKLYGVDKMRSLLAMCALVEGVPMLYQGDEDPTIYGGTGEKSVEFISRVYALRKTVPAISEGAASYESVKASDGVFACLWKSRNQTALVLVSLNGNAVESKLDLPAALSGSYSDVLSGDALPIKSGVAITMKPYQTRVMVRSAK